tara:strand:+ start:4850 stop:5236 length:387 start_codon:yes stop_codon:yes gene_type:complete
MKKLIIFLVVIGAALLVAIPVKADHRYNNYYNNNNYNYGGYYNNRAGNYNRWHDPRGYYNQRHGHRPYGGRHHRRNNDIAGIIIGGIIINEIFRNSNRRQYNNVCRDVRRSGYDHYGNQVIYYERICN